MRGMCSGNTSCPYDVAVVLQPRPQDGARWIYTREQMKNVELEFLFHDWILEGSGDERGSLFILCSLATPPPPPRPPTIISWIDPPASIFLDVTKVV